MIVVTGASGFIGSNIVRALNRKNIKDIIVVDSMENGKKFFNLKDLDFLDYIDKENFLKIIKKNKFIRHINTIFHQGACSNTKEWNGNYLMKNNFTYSKRILNACFRNKINFIYASSASVYGLSSEFAEKRINENPLNMYAFSKFQFDQYVRSFSPKNSQIVGLRYFNVYGPFEQNKGDMASVIFQFYNQIIKNNKIKIFTNPKNGQHGEQKRDFIHVDDVVSVNMWCFENPEISGIFNVGTGLSATFNQVAREIIEFMGYGEIEYIPFPESLLSVYQDYTQADISLLRKFGYMQTFKNIKEGIRDYLPCLKEFSI